MTLSKRIAFWCAAVAIVLAALACSVDPGPVQGKPLPPQWDPRLTALGITYTPAPNCAPGCWRLVSAEYLDEGQSQGLHHVFARTLDVAGNQIVDRFTVGWADGAVTVDTKAPPDYGDIALWDCYAPNEGERGGYRAWGGTWEAQSDTVEGLGLPYCAHVSFRLVWQWVNGGSAPTATPSVPPVPSVTPTPSVIPCQMCDRRLYLPIVHNLSRG